MRFHLVALLAATAVLSMASLVVRPAPAGAAATVVMYGTTGAGRNPSSLYRIDPASGAGTLIGPTGYNAISAMDFHPQTGVLYGMGRRVSDDTPVLVRINTTTGAATEIGPAGGTARSFPDMSFRRSDSTLFAFSFGPERLATINLATGAATYFNPIGAGFGDATAFDFNDTLLHASATSFGTVNQTTGVFTPTTLLTFIPAGDPFRTIGAMKFQPQTGKLYGVIVDGSLDSKLALIDPNAATVTTIGQTVPGLDSLAIQPAAPTITKTFSPSSVTAGSTATLSFSLTNPNLVPLSAVGFTDPLPAAVSVAASNGLTGSCGGTVTAMPGSGTIALANGRLAASASCTFSVTVMVTSSGSITNTTGAVSSAQSGTGGTAVAAIGVDGAKSLAPIPQLFQNPGAIAIVNSQPRTPPTPAKPVAVAASQPVAAGPVLRPPSTGDAGLKLD